MYYFGVIPGEKEPVPAWKLDWNQAKVVCAMTTFFEVFYISHCYRRYTTLYSNVRDLFTDIDLIVLDLRTRVRDEHPAHAWLACRYIIASALLLLHSAHADSHCPPDATITASEQYSTGGESSSSDDDDHRSQGLDAQRHAESLLTEAKEVVQLQTSRRATMQSHGFVKSTPRGARLLKPEEEAALQRMSEVHQPMVLFYWSLQALDKAYAVSNAPPNARQAGITRLMKMHGDVTNLADSLSLPVPFQYFHLLNVMVFVNIVVLAYVMGTTRNLGAPLIFCACEVTFMGLIELASQLSNPFGNDEVDFPLNAWLSDLVRKAKLVMESKYRENTAEAWAPVLAGAQRRLRLSTEAGRQGACGVRGWLPAEGG